MCRYALIFGLELSELLVTLGTISIYIGSFRKGSIKQISGKQEIGYWVAASDEFCNHNMHLKVKPV